MTDYEVEGPLDDPRAPLTAYLESAESEHVLQVTKEALVRHWLSDDLLPSSTAVFVLHGPATARHCGLLQVQAEQRQLPLLFFGDLDPMDLSTFATLRAGGAEWDVAPAAMLPIMYRGIDDRVIELAERNIKAPPKGRAHGSGPASMPFLRGVAIRMIPDERRHLRVVEKLVPDLEDLVGPRCLRLLHDGWKLEVEALHPRSFKRGFSGKLMKLLLGARPARQR